MKKKSKRKQSFRKVRRHLLHANLNYTDYKLIHQTPIEASFFGTRETKEQILKRNGWERLIDRADVWVDTKAVGDDAHDVYIFRHAFEQAIRTRLKNIKSDKKRFKQLHHNDAALSEIILKECTLMDDWK